MRRGIWSAVAALGLAAGAVTSASAPAVAAPVADWEPGFIISDSIMYDPGTMSTAQVTQFVADKGAKCVATSAGFVCLKNYHESTPTRPADSYCPGTYVGASDETAAQIISKVATACGINPQVLLVTLQKEQGLVTAAGGASATTYSKALGFGCPDGAPCDPQYAGFANQVYSAARQLKRYQANPTSYSYRAGRTNTILYSPNAACGSSQVYIVNQATAGLYNYTPYQPNAAALAAGYGSGDACSSYGNRNFQLFFTDWFGSPKQRTPVGVIDAAVDAGNGQARVMGWAFDPDTSAAIAVHAYVDGVLAAAFTAGGPRPDVYAAYQHGAISGYDALVPAAAGTHNVCLYGIDGTGGMNMPIGCRQVTTTNRGPIGVIDGAQAVGTDRISVGGWAFDPDGTAPIAVHVYVDGALATGTSSSGARPDVQAAFGRGAVSGFAATVPAAAGRHTVCVYGIDSNAGPNTQIGCRTVDVANHAPIGVIDYAQDSGSGQINVSGWTLDPDADTSLAVHVYLDNALVGAVSASGARPDVAAVYGIGSRSGFAATVPASAGNHSVCLYAIDSTAGNSLLGCRSVQVHANRAPVGVVDGVWTMSGGQMAVGGWAFDPDASSAAVTVQVSVDGAPASTFSTTGPRPDVAAAYGVGPNTGYGSTFAVAGGAHRVCVTAVDTRDPMVMSQLGCRDMTIG